ncbi:MAG: ASCH domain-containing protein [Phenylobacterium sp.]|uniref:ASCH domain-containing protein n=1 Tax=Phenylobacterium sp. TaxID=1871053 RepID=UPI001A1D22EA|nr:ASCH domain-containing protein [Phenylobacterium sp.]MBJ7409787.1 ASCH domain-containing protein [Phenylobacterium sp.]
MDGSGNDWRSLESFAFGDSPDMADRLLGFVLSGAKTATCWSVRDGQQTEVGKRMVVNDGAGQPRAVIETVSLEQLRFNEVGWTFALAEGEGDECLEDWREGHRAYFTRNGGFAPDMMLWCERFRLVETLDAKTLGEGARR